MGSGRGKLQVVCLSGFVLPSQVQTWHGCRLHGHNHAENACHGIGVHSEENLIAVHFAWVGCYS